MNVACKSTALSLQPIPAYLGHSCLAFTENIFEICKLYKKINLQNIAKHFKFESVVYLPPSSTSSVIEELRRPQLCHLNVSYHCILGKVR